MTFLGHKGKIKEERVQRRIATSPLVPKYWVREELTMIKEGNNFSGEWEVAYKKRTHQSQWPWSDLVSLVHRYVNTKKDDFSVLELGCGYGANIPFFLSLGINYSAVDGSGFVVSHLKERFVEVQETIKQADFTKDIPFEREFDLIVDRASITHNDADVALVRSRRAIA